MAFIAKNFKKFLKFKKSNKFGNKSSNKPSNSALECYECHKKGHMKKDCPDRKKNNFKKDRFKKKQAFSVTWDDSESSSSDSDNESDAEQANVCFMATDNNVSDLSFEDLIEINSELLDKLKSIKKECKETKIKLQS